MTVCSILGEAFVEFNFILKKAVAQTNTMVKINNMKTNVQTNVIVQKAHKNTSIEQCSSLEFIL